METVTRYTVGVKGEEGAVRFTSPRQGQYMLATPGEAITLREAMLKNNSRRTLFNVFGTSDPGNFIVCEVQCYPIHFDPMSFPIPWKG